jgi:hypothetical protein
MGDRCVGLVCVVLVLAPLGFSQQNSAAKPTSALKLENRIPTVSLQFKDDESLPGLLASPVLAYPMQCASDGSVFVEMLQGADYQDRRLYSISRDGVHEYAKEKIPSLHDARVFSYYPSDSRVVLLVNAMEESREGKVRIDAPDGSRKEVVQNIGERLLYLVEFDRDGSYKRASQAWGALSLSRVGVFTSGDLLAFGVDRSSELPQLAILSSDGTLLRTLDVPGAVKQWYKDERNSATGSTQGAVFLPPTQFVPFDAGILVVALWSTAPVLEVREGGAIRPIRIRLPAGLSLDSLVPSSGGHWYVRVRNSARGDERAELDFHALYEVDPADGKVIRRIETGTVPSDGIACVDNGRFIAFRRDDNGKFVGMRGEISP